MKRTYIWFVFFLYSFAADAQLIGIDDFLRASIWDSDGSARFASMAGAFGALGGDVSSIGINPAGTAIVRKHHLSFTLMGKGSNVKSEFTGIENNANHSLINIPSLGCIFNVSEFAGPVRWVVGATYQQKSSYTRKVAATGNYKESGIVDRFAEKANSDKNFFNPNAMIASNAFDRYNPIDWDVVMAYDTYLIDYNENDNEFSDGLAVGDLTKQQIDILYKGFSGEANLSVGMDFKDRFFAGISLGVPIISYNALMNFGEFAHEANQSDFERLVYDTDLRIQGTGLNFKLGAIYKPVHSVRIGLAFHSPDYFFSSVQKTDEEESLFKKNMENLYYASIDASYKDGHHYSSHPETDYFLSFDRMKTPFKAIGSFAYIIGKHGLVSADCEYADYSRIKLGGTYYKNEFDADIKTWFKSTWNFRFGGETRIGDFSLRAGCAFRPSPDKQYDLSRRTWSSGIGYRLGGMNIDLAYVQTSFNDYFTAYKNANPVTEKSIERKIFLTLGWTFE